MVRHANKLKSYGRGVIDEIVPSPCRAPSKAYVRFESETARRLVWLDDLSPALALPLAAPPRPQQRIVYPVPA